MYILELPIQEIGIRKFCIWAVGLALSTLQKINNTTDYTSAQEVTISKTTTQKIIAACNSSITSNLLLKHLFQRTAQGLPKPEVEIEATHSNYMHKDLPEKGIPSDNSKGQQ
jgi:farnesyl-diphosphate farnesyltransferase